MSATEEIKEKVIDKTLSTLDAQLVTILNDVTADIGKAKNFLVEQTPLVVQELLNWYMVWNFVLFLASIIILILIMVGYRKMMTKANKPNWMFNERGDTWGDPRVAVPGIVFIVMFIIAMNIINLQWLKIYIAPKLWLIEYASALVK
jgi:hypothetical protein